MQDFYTKLIAKRLGGENFGKSGEIYKFELIKRAKAAALAANPSRRLIDMGVGEPDRPADPTIAAVLASEAAQKSNRFYADNGIEEFKDAAAAFLASYYGVGGLNPRTQILHGIGSKPILALLPLCLINPGDIILQTVPGYPVAATYTRYLGGEVYPLPLTAKNRFFPDLGQIPPAVLRRAKILYLNYPNNPTSQTATKEFFQDVVAFALRNNIMVLSDAAYSALTYDGEAPLSFLTIPGASEVGVELHSLSKSFNMTGWRLAFLVGAEKIIKAYGTVKDNTDSGQFRAIQKAGIYALKHPELIKINQERYSRRFNKLVPLLRSRGFSAVKPKAGFYLYIPSPVGCAVQKVRFTSAQQAAEYLIQKALISTVPWDDAGAYLRISVTYEAETEEQEDQIMQDLDERLAQLSLLF